MALPLIAAASLLGRAKLAKDGVTALVSPAPEGDHPAPPDPDEARLTALGPDPVRAAATESAPRDDKRQGVDHLLDSIQAITTSLRAHVGDPSWERSMGVKAVREVAALIEQVPSALQALPGVAVVGAKQKLTRANGALDALKPAVATEELATALDATVASPRKFAVTEAARKLWARQALAARAPAPAPASLTRSRPMEGPLGD